MNMSIIIVMNIYIRPDLEEHLRKESSMSGLVNKLLYEHYDKLGYNIQRPVIASPDIAKIIEQSTDETLVVPEIIKTPAQAKKVVDNTGFITKSFSSRKKG